MTDTTKPDDYQALREALKDADFILQAHPLASASYNVTDTIRRLIDERDRLSRLLDAAAETHDQQRSDLNHKSTKIVRLYDERDAAIRERDEARAEREAMRVDAERYRKLRACHWYDSPICVVMHAKHDLRVGTYCPSDELLDEEIDAMRAAAPMQEGGL